MPYKDPEKAKQAKHESYLRRKEKQAKADKARKQRKYELSRSLMTPCCECGAFDVAFMDWHHVNPDDKVETIAELIKNASIHRLMTELKKCICLCSNCHRKLHFYS